MSNTIERLRAVRVRLDAARAVAPTLDAEWRRLSRRLPPPRRRHTAPVRAASAAEAFEAWHVHLGDLDALETSGLHRDTIVRRLKDGFSPESAVSRLPGRRRKEGAQ